MEMFRVQFLVMATLAPAMALFLPSINAQSSAAPPAPAPTSDGVAVDQGVAYVLMLLALMLLSIFNDVFIGEGVVIREDVGSVLGASAKEEVTGRFSFTAELRGAVCYGIRLLEMYCEE
ncbi:Arabinogalactan peptide, AGP [Parasponia andersonii]|uniref:Arabinogalactan peptide, AGP n=1 Tax=Parasponia andersonii TaxID=3476 RepID=A0A2P5CN66_PARAD|nr:Arabinogalactan peptide, AGP [Parasponia andersonii]